jgi:streptogramin lyase
MNWLGRCALLCFAGALCVSMLGAAPYHGSNARLFTCGWNIVTTPSAQPQAVLNASAASSQSDIWAVGSQSAFASTLVEHFDGSAWSIIPSPNVGTNVNVLAGASALTPNDAWAVGQAAMPQSPPQTLAEHWDGHAWSVVPAVNPASAQFFYGVDAISHNDVWAVGQQLSNGNHNTLLVEHFNGQRWYVRNIPRRGGFAELRAVSADSSTDVWVVGSTMIRDAHGMFRATPVSERWNGSTWTDEIPIDRGDFARYYAVKVNSPTDVWAAGYAAHTTGNTVAHALIEHWDGTHWSIVPNSAQSGPQSILYSLNGSSPTDIWSAGFINNYQVLLTEHWDGSRWSAVGAPIPYGSSGAFYSVLDFGSNDVWAMGWDDQQPLAENYCTPVVTGDPQFHEYPIPPLNSQNSDPRETAIAHDKTAWFTDFNNNAIGHLDLSGHVAEYVLPQQNAFPGGIALGPDGNMWVPESQGGHIARITPTGAITEFKIPFNAGAGFIVAGTDGALWFSEQTARLGRITVNGAYSSFKIPFQAFHLAASSDGTIWFCGFIDNRIGQFSIATGVTSIHTLPVQSVNVFGIAVGPDGSAWASETNYEKIAHIKTDGSIVEYPIPNQVGEPGELTTGGDGNIWFADFAGGQIGSIAPDGTYALYTPRHNGGLQGISGMPGDNSIWFVENNFSRIGRLSDIR